MDKVTEEKRVRAFGRGSQEVLKKFDIRAAFLERGIKLDNTPDM